MMRPAPASTSGADVNARGAWRIVALIAAVAVAVRLGALFAHRHLSLDDGAYGVSTADMRHGLLPYRDLFASQGPLHFPLLFLGDALGLHAVNAPRVAPFLAGVAVALGVWAAARRLGSAPSPALIAALLAATTGSILWTTGPVSADGLAAAFTIWSVWAALVFRDSPRAGWALLSGALAGGALATKPLMFPALIAIAWWLWSRRRVTDVAWAAGGAIAVWFASAVPWGLGRVWSQSIAFHMDKHRQSGPITQLGKLTTTMLSRDLVLLGVLALVVPAVWRKCAGQPARRSDQIVLVVWTGVLIIVLIGQTLLLVSHIAALVLPLTLLFAIAPPPMRWLAVALIVLVPIQAYQLSDIVFPSGYRGADAEVVRALRQLPPGARAMSDIGGLVWQAGRITPPQMNDNSNARISTGRETTATVLNAAADPRTCAAVIWSFRWADELPGLRDGLRARGYSLAREWAPDRQLWLKNQCDPGNLAADRADRARAGAARVRSRD
jgi:hypothetical protein